MAKKQPKKATNEAKARKARIDELRKIVGLEEKVSDDELKAQTERIIKQLDQFAKEAEKLKNDAMMSQSASGMFSKTQASTHKFSAAHLSDKFHRLAQMFNTF